MKKNKIALTIILLTAMLLTACAKSPKQSFEDLSAPLVTVDGEVILSAEDFVFAEYQNEAAKKYSHTAGKSGDALFTELAEHAVISHIAEDFGEAYDKASLEEEYDEMKSSLVSTDAEYKCMAYVEDNMGIDDEKYRELYLKGEYQRANARAFVADIAESNPSIADSEELKERVLNEIYLLEANYDIEISYPGFENKSLTYESVTG